MKKFLLLLICAANLSLLTSCKQDYENTKVPEYTFTGESVYQEDILITPHTNNHNAGWLMLLDYKGNLKKTKKLDSYPYAFKKYKMQDGSIVYGYLETIQYLMGTITSYEECFLSLMDEDFNLLTDSQGIRQIVTEDEAIWGAIENTPGSTYPLENHDYEILGPNHYLLCSTVPVFIDYEKDGQHYNVQLVNNVIQEVKDGKVIWEYSTATNSPELVDYAMELMGGEKIDYTKPGNLNGINIFDYCHINDVTIGKNNKLYISMRNIGFGCLDKSTKKFDWILGKYVRDLKAADGSDFDSARIPLYQHKINVNQDGSFVLFDNLGCATNNTRICRFWIDEAAKKVTNYKEYLSTQARSVFMGSAEFVDEENEVIDICYGGKMGEPAFEEYSFSENKQKFSLTFKSKDDIYQVVRHTTELK